MIDRTPKQPPPGMIDVATALLDDVDDAPVLRDGELISAAENSRRQRARDAALAADLAKRDAPK